MVTGRVGQVCACAEQDAEIEAIADIAAGPIKPRNMTVLRLWEARCRRANMRISDGGNEAAIGLISACSPADGIGAAARKQDFGTSRRQLADDRSVRVDSIPGRPRWRKGRVVSCRADTRHS